MAGLLRRAALEAKTATVLRDNRRMMGDLGRDERLAPAELATLSLRRGLGMAAWAARSSPFYRDRYAAAGLTFGDLRDPAVFEHLPIVEKADLRDAWHAFASSEATPRTTRVGSTSGSTGQPLRVLVDTRVPVRTFAWRQHRWWGVEPYEDVAHAVRADRSPRQDLAYRLQRWPTRHLLLDGGRVDEASVAAFVRSWRRMRPALLLGYVSVVRELAEWLLRAGTRLPAPRAVGVTGSPVTDPDRRVITEAFGSPVYDQYRCAEVPYLAAECRSHHGLHVHGDLRRVEVVDPQGRVLPPGRTGEVLVTDFTNRAFPLVRYRLGDHAALLSETCDCGITLPLMSAVAGRSVDVLRLPGGRAVATGMTTLFDGAPGAVRQFQVHQHADHSVTLRCVRGDDPAADTVMAGVLDDLSRRLFRQVPVRLELVERIPHDGGKTRVVRSDVAAGDG